MTLLAGKPSLRRRHRCAFDLRRVPWAALLALVLSALTNVGCAGTGFRFERTGKALIVHRAALYPETIAYDAKRDKFLLSSLREGAIYEVDERGEATQLVGDPRLCSVLGIAVDSTRARLWAVNSDLGASARPSAAGPKKLAAVGVYDLTTGKPLRYVDLSGLSPGPHLLNGIALDAQGNAYVTDSFAASIYKVDAQGRASVFLHDAQFAGEGINLNGVVVHPDGYLLVIKKSDGALFKVPLDEPSRFSKVASVPPLIGGDGLTLVGSTRLVVIANQTPSFAANAAFSLASKDDWRSAQLQAKRELGNVYPTTGVLRGETLYVVHSKLNELMQAPAEQKAELRGEPTIAPIARVLL